MFNWLKVRWRRFLALFAEKQVCPRMAGMTRFKGWTSDYWERLPNGDHVCSACGCWHPVEFMAYVHAGGQLENTDKYYKVYVRRPGVSNAAQGAIKFYTPHLDYPSGRPLADITADIRAMNEALNSQRRRESFLK